MIDVNVFSGNWAFRDYISSSLSELMVSDLLDESEISCALVSPLDGVLREDPQSTNVLLHHGLPGYRLVYSAHCKREERPERFTVFPVYVLNPALRKWQQNLRVCREELQAVAIKLHPNYHIYRLTDGAARELLTACGEAGLPVIVQMRMQDTRSHHPLMQVPDVDINEVLEAAAATPQTNWVIGGIKWGEASGKANDINALPNVWLDISQCEIVDVLRRLIRLFGARRLLFGTHAPFFYVKSALLKLEEARLTEEERELITERNARGVFRLE